MSLLTGPWNSRGSLPRLPFPGPARYTLSCRQPLSCNRLTENADYSEPPSQSRSPRRIPSLRGWDLLDPRGNLLQCPAPTALHSPAGMLRCYVFLWNWYQSFTLCFLGRLENSPPVRPPVWFHLSYPWRGWQAPLSTHKFPLLVTHIVPESEFCLPNAWAFTALAMIFRQQAFFPAQLGELPPIPSCIHPSLNSPCCCGPLPVAALCWPSASKKRERPRSAAHFRLSGLGRELLGHSAPGSN